MGPVLRILAPRTARAAIASLLLLAASSCASGGANWVRADGSPGSKEQLERDRMACFPTNPELRPGSASVRDAEDCMRNRGWRKS